MKLNLRLVAMGALVVALLPSHGAFAAYDIGLRAVASRNFEQSAEAVLKAQLRAQARADAEHQCAELTSGGGQSSLVRERFSVTPGLAVDYLYIDAGYSCHFSGSTKELVPHLLEALLTWKPESGEPYRETYDVAVRELVANPGVALPILLRAVLDYQDYRGVGAAEALGKIGAKDPEVLRALALAAANANREPRVRAVSVMAIHAIVKRDPAALGSSTIGKTEVRRLLLEVLADRQLYYDLRREIAHLFALIGESADLVPLTRVLVAATEDLDHHFLLLYLSQSIPALGKAAASEKQELIRLLGEARPTEIPDAKIVIDTVLSMLSLEPTERVAVLTELLLHASAPMRVQAVESLAELGGAAKSALFRLRDLAAHDSDSHVRFAADYAVRLIERS